MNYCTITPSRGDRSELLNRQVTWLGRITDLPNPPSASYIIAEVPVSSGVDLVPRVLRGIEWAKRASIDFVFIIEDDDYYPDNYFSLFGDLSEVDFVGCEVTQYYNLKNRTFQRYDHPERSSLFCTGFRISAIDKFHWPNDDYKWLDIKLWEYANQYRKRIKLLKDNSCVGIKGHGLGLCAGKGHTLQLKNHDPDLSQLKEAVSEEAFEFYKQLMEKHVTE